MKKIILFLLLLTGSAHLFAQNELGSTTTHGTVNINANTATYSSSKLRLVKWSNNNAHIDVMDNKDLMLNYYNGRHVIFGKGGGAASAHSIFKSNGVLGINTLGPTSGYHLDVNGKALVRSDFRVNGTFYLGNGSSDQQMLLDGPNAKMRLLAYGSQQNVWIQAGRAWSGGSTADIVFSGMYGTPQLMVIKGNGNVGIGTTNPGSYKLAVEGKIGAHEIKVTTAGWADFVFYDDYVLRPLADVEQFIKEKGHLPDVPSESEVLENGIEVGAMNATLLQKIEELTLYMIEMKKENMQLANSVLELKEENKQLKNRKGLIQELMERLESLEKAAN